ncbi:WXG100-like domain-containing protein [Allokutzneria oryzae]|uniref:NAD(+)--protein-arginine ADP-ribosyltransferase n=1 Tax=Allokutzneria oryzae TaxID=1378989 RepID=A0ABV6A7A7_9PSEU
MGQVPPSANRFFEIVVGQEWPEADEDELFALGRAWEQASVELKALAGRMDGPFALALSAVEGAAADAFRGHAEKLRKAVPELAGAAHSLGNHARQTGLNVDYAKKMIVLTLVWLAVEVALALASLFGAVLVPALTTAAQISVRMVLRQLFQALLRGATWRALARGALLGALRGALVGVAFDGVIQTSQFIEGNRHAGEWDATKTGHAAAFGAISGAFGGVFSVAGNMAVAKPISTIANRALRGAAKVGKTVIEAGAAGAATAAVMMPLNDGEFDWRAVTSGAIGGIAAARGRLPNALTSGLKSLLHGPGAGAEGGLRTPVAEAASPSAKKGLPALESPATTGTKDLAGASPSTMDKSVGVGRPATETNSPTGSRATEPTVVSTSDQRLPSVSSEQAKSSSRSPVGDSTPAQAAERPVVTSQQVRPTVEPGSSRATESPAATAAPRSEATPAVKDAFPGKGIPLGRDGVSPAVQGGPETMASLHKQAMERAAQRGEEPPPPPPPTRDVPLAQRTATVDQIRASTDTASASTATQHEPFAGKGRQLGGGTESPRVHPDSPETRAELDAARQQRQEERAKALPRTETPSESGPVRTASDPERVKAFLERQAERAKQAETAARVDAERRATESTPEVDPKRVAADAERVRAFRERQTELAKQAEAEAAARKEADRRTAEAVRDNSAALREMDRPGQIADQARRHREAETARQGHSDAETAAAVRKNSESLREMDRPGQIADQRERAKNSGESPESPARPPRRQPRVVTVDEILGTDRDQPHGDLAPNNPGGDGPGTATTSRGGSHTMVEMPPAPVREPAVIDEAGPQREHPAPDRPDATVPANKRSDPIDTPAPDTPAGAGKPATPLRPDTSPSPAVESATAALPGTTPTGPDIGTWRPAWVDGDVETGPVPDRPVDVDVPGPVGEQPPPPALPPVPELLATWEEHRADLAADFTARTQDVVQLDRALRAARAALAGELEAHGPLSATAEHAVRSAVDASVRHRVSELQATENGLSDMTAAAEFDRLLRGLPDWVQLGGELDGLLGRVDPLLREHRDDHRPAAVERVRDAFVDAVVTPVRDEVHRSGVQPLASERRQALLDAAEQRFAEFAPEVPARVAVESTLESVAAELREVMLDVLDDDQVPLAGARNIVTARLGEVADAIREWQNGTALADVSQHELDVLARLAAELQSRAAFGLIGDVAAAQWRQRAEERVRRAFLDRYRELLHQSRPRIGAGADPVDVVPAAFNRFGRGVIDDVVARVEIARRGRPGTDPRDRLLDEAIERMRADLGRRVEDDLEFELRADGALRRGAEDFAAIAGPHAVQADVLDRFGADYRRELTSRLHELWRRQNAEKWAEREKETGDAFGVPSERNARPEPAAATILPDEPARGGTERLWRRDAAEWQAILDADAGGRTEPDTALIRHPEVFPATRSDAWANLTRARQDLARVVVSRDEALARVAAGGAGSSRDAEPATLAGVEDAVRAARNELGRAEADLRAWGNDPNRLTEAHRRWFADSLRERPRLPGGVQNTAVQSEVDTGTEAPDDLLAELRASVAEGVPAGEELLGPDPFGLRQAPPPPEFLEGFDFRAVHADQLPAFFEAIGLTRSRPRGRLSAAGLARDPERVTVGLRPTAEQRRWGVWLEPDRGTPVDLPPLPERTEIPHQVHSIWLGGPLRATGSGAVFRRNLTDAVREHGEWGDVVLWTDVPRERVEQARAAGETASAQLRDVRDMVEWAENTGVLLVNVDEVFSAAAPMTLNEPYRVELAKQVGPGYAAASDILRLEILRRFGGVYSDGDNRMWPTDARGSLPASVRQIAEPSDDPETGHGFAVHRVGGWGVGNSAIVAFARHPFLDIYLGRVAERYGMGQRELYLRQQHQVGLDVLESGERATWTEHGLARRAYRNSVMHRTGPYVFRDVAVDLGLRSDGAHQMPAVRGIQVGNANSWLDAEPEPQADDASPEPVAPDRAESLDVVRRVVATLVRELSNRQGDLHLTLVEPVVSRQPDPARVWTAVLRFIAEDPALAMRVRTVTDHRHDADGDVTVVLPQEALRLLDFQNREHRWWLGERQRPVWMSTADDPALPSRPVYTRAERTGYVVWHRPIAELPRDFAEYFFAPDAHQDRYHRPGHVEVSLSRPRLVPEAGRLVEVRVDAGGAIELTATIERHRAEGVALPPELAEMTPEDAAGRLWLPRHTLDRAHITAIRRPGTLRRRDTANGRGLTGVSLGELYLHSRGSGAQESGPIPEAVLIGASGLVHTYNHYPLRLDGPDPEAQAAVRAVAQRLLDDGPGAAERLARLLGRARGVPIHLAPSGAGRPEPDSDPGAGTSAQHAARAEAPVATEADLEDFRSFEILADYLGSAGEIARVDPGLSRLHPEELAAIHGYTHTLYHAIDNFLRGEDEAPHARALIAVLTSAVTRFPLRYTGWATRTLRDEPDQVRSRFQPGTRVTDRSFARATVDGDGVSADARRVVQRVFVRNGAYIASVSRFTEEREVLLPPGTEFDVLSAEESDGRLVITLRQAEETPSAVPAPDAVLEPVLSGRRSSEEERAALEDLVGEPYWVTSMAMKRTLRASAHSAIEDTADIRDLMGLTWYLIRRRLDVDLAMRSGDHRALRPVVVTATAALAHLPVHRGEVYRQVGLTEAESARYVPGMQITEPGFTVATTTAPPADSTAHTLRITSTTGRDTAPLIGADDAVIVLPPNSRFLVEEGDHEANEIRLIEIEPDAGDTAPEGVSPERWTEAITAASGLVHTYNHYRLRVDGVDPEAQAAVRLVARRLVDEGDEAALELAKRMGQARGVPVHEAPSGAGRPESVHDPDVGTSAQHAAPVVTLPPFLRSNAGLGSVAVERVAGAETVRGVVEQQFPAMAAGDLAEVERVVREEFGSLLGDGRALAARVAGQWYELNLRATLDTAGAREITTDTPPHPVEAAIQSNRNTTRTTGPATVGSVTAAVGALAGGVTVTGRVTVPTGRAFSRITQGISVQDSRDVVSDDPSRRVRVPVAFTVSTVNRTGQELGSRTTSGTVDLLVPQEFTALATTSEPVEPHQPEVAAEFVPETVQLPGAAERVLAAMPVGVTGIGTPGRAELLRVISPEFLRAHLGAMLRGSVASAGLVDGSGRTRGVVELTASLGAPALLGSVHSGQMRSQEQSTRQSEHVGTVRSGFDVGLSAGGVVLPNVGATLGLSYSMAGTGQTAVGGAATRRRGVQVDGTELYEAPLFVTLRPHGGEPITVNGTTHFRMATARQPVAGERRFPPSYLHHGNTIGHARVLRIAGLTETLDRVREELVALPGANRLFPRFGAEARSWSAADIEGAAANHRVFTTVFSPENLHALTDTLTSTGVSAMLSTISGRHEHVYEILLRARISGTPEHLGLRADTAVRGQLSDSQRLHGVRGRERGIGITVDAGVRPAGGAAFSGRVAYARGTEATAGPGVTRTTSHSGSTDAHAFEVPLELHAEIRYHRTLRTELSSLVLGRPGEHVPAVRRIPVEGPPGAHMRLLVPASETTAAEPRPRAEVPVALPLAAPSRIDELLANHRRENASRQFDWLYFAGLEGTDVMHRAAVDLVSQAAGGDRALVLEGSPAREQLDGAINPDMIAARFERMVAHGDVITRLAHPRRAADRVAALGVVARLRLADAELVSTADDVSLDNSRQATQRAGDGVSAATELAGGLGPSGTATSGGLSGVFGASVVVGRRWATSRGTEISGTVERTLTTPPSGRTVLIRVPAAVTMVAESRREALGLRFGHHVAGATVDSLGAYFRVSEDQARDLGLLPPAEPGPPMPLPDLVVPAPLSHPAGASIGLGTVEVFPDLTRLVAGVAPHVETRALDDLMGTFQRLNALTSRSGAVALLDSALNGGAAITVHRPRLFGSETQRAVLRANVREHRSLGATADGTGIGNYQAFSVQRSTARAHGPLWDAGVRAGARGAHHDPAQHRAGQSGATTAVRAGEQRLHGTATTATDQSSMVSYTSGPVVRHAVVADFTLTLERGGRTIAEASLDGQEVVFRLPADDLTTRARNRNDQRTEPVVARWAGQGRGARIRAAVDEWRADGVVVPDRAVPETLAGVSLIREAVNAALREARAGNVLLGPETSAQAVLDAALSAELVRPALPEMLSRGLELPVLRGDGQIATVTVHMRAREPRMVGLSGDIGMDRPRQRSSSHQSDIRRAPFVMVNPSVGPGIGATATESGQPALGGGLQDMGHTGRAQHARGVATGGSAQADRNAKPQGRTGLVEYDLDVKVVVKVADLVLGTGPQWRAPRHVVSDLTIPAATRLRMSEEDAVRQVDVGELVLDAHRAVTEAAQLWQEAETAARLARRAVQDADAVNRRRMDELFAGTAHLTAEELVREILETGPGNHDARGRLAEAERAARRAATTWADTKRFADYLLATGVPLARIEKVLGKLPESEWEERMRAAAGEVDVHVRSRLNLDGGDAYHHELVMRRAYEVLQAERRGEQPREFVPPPREPGTIETGLRGGARQAVPSEAGPSGLSVQQTRALISAGLRLTGAGDFFGALHESVSGQRPDLAGLGADGLRERVARRLASAAVVGAPVPGAENGFALAARLLDPGDDRSDLAPLLSRVAAEEFGLLISFVPGTGVPGSFGPTTGTPVVLFGAEPDGTRFMGSGPLNGGGPQATQYAALLAELPNLRQGVDVSAHVGELVRLADVDHSADVMAAPEVRRMLRRIDAALPSGGAVRIRSVVRDAVLSTAVVPTRGHRVIQPFSHRRLEAVLTDIALHLEAGADPFGTPGSVLEHLDYRPNAPMPVRLAVLALANLVPRSRSTLAADPVFRAIVASPSLVDALFAASGHDEQQFLNTCDPAAMNTALLGRVPTIAGLLHIGGAMVEHVNDVLAAATADQLSRADRPGRTIGELVRQRIREAERVFATVESEAIRLAGIGAPMAEWARLTRQWGRVMQKLAAVVDLSAGPDSVPVLTKKPVPGAWGVSAALMTPLAVDRPGRRVSAVNGAAYQESLDARMADVDGRSRRFVGITDWTRDRAQTRLEFWRRVRYSGVAQLETENAITKHALALRATTVDGVRGYSLADPKESEPRFLRADEFFAWAHRTDARIEADALTPLSDHVVETGPVRTDADTPYLAVEYGQPADLVIEEELTFRATAEILNAAREALRSVGSKIRLTETARAGNLRVVRIELGDATGSRDVAAQVLGGQPSTLVLRPNGSRAVMVPSALGDHVHGAHALARRMVTAGRDGLTRQELALGLAAREAQQDNEIVAEYRTALVDPATVEVARRWGVNEAARARVGEAYVLAPVSGIGNANADYYLVPVIAETTDGAQLVLETRGSEVGLRVLGPNESFFDVFGRDGLFDAPLAMVMTGHNPAPNRYVEFDVGSREPGTVAWSRRAWPRMPELTRPHEDRPSPFEPRLLADPDYLGAALAAVTSADDADPRYEEEVHRLAEVAGAPGKLAGFAEQVAKLVAWLRSEDQPPPVVTISGGVGNSPWKDRADEVGRQRRAAVEQELRSALAVAFDKYRVPLPVAELRIDQIRQESTRRGLLDALDGAGSRARRRVTVALSPDTRYAARPARPAAFQATEAQHRWLVTHGRREIPIAGDGDCFFSALLVTAGGHASVRGKSVLDLRNRLADRFRDNIAEYGAFLTGEDPARAEADIRRAGSWASAAGDLVPLLAADEFGLRLRLVDPRGTVLTVGGQGHEVTLLYDGSHYSATAGQPSSVPSGRPPVLRGAGRMRTTIDYELTDGSGIDETSPAGEILERAPFAYREQLEVREEPGGGQALNFPLFRPTRPIRSVLKPPLDVSADGTLALPGGFRRARQFYATRAVIDNARRELRFAGSRLVLRTDENTFVEFLHEGRPHRLFRVTAQFGGTPKDVCRDFAADMAGDNHMYAVLHDTRPGGTGETAVADIDTSEGVVVGGTAHLAEALVRVAADERRLVDLTPRWAREQVMAWRRQESSPRVGAQYGRLLNQALPDGQTSRAVLSEQAAVLGLNEYAFPRISEGYLLQSVEPEPSPGAPPFRDFSRSTPGHNAEYRDHRGYGYHFATVVVESEDGQHHLTIENANTRHDNKKVLLDALDKNVDLYRDRFDDVERMLREAVDRGELDAKDPRFALLAAMRARAEGHEDPSGLKGLLDRWHREISGVAVYPHSGDDWRFRMAGMAAGETFFEQATSLGDQRATPSTSNPLLMVVNSHYPRSRVVVLAPGEPALDTGGREQVDSLLARVATIAAWRGAHRLGLPEIRLTITSAPSDWPIRREREQDVTAYVRRRLEHHLAERQDGAAVGAADVVVSVTHRKRQGEESELVMLVSTGGAPVTGAEAARLAREIGLGSVLPRPFGDSAPDRLNDLVELARHVDGVDTPDVRRLADLRRLTDLVSRTGGPGGGFRAEHLDPLVRTVFGRHESTHVSMADRRAVVDLVPAAKNKAGHRAITVEDLKEQVPTDPSPAPPPRPGGLRIVLDATADVTGLRNRAEAVVLELAHRHTSAWPRLRVTGHGPGLPEETVAGMVIGELAGALSRFVRHTPPGVRPLDVPLEVTRGTETPDGPPFADVEIDW